MALSLRAPQVSASRSAVRSARPARRVVAAKAGLETSLVISASTLAFLSIGRVRGEPARAVGGEPPRPRSIAAS